MAHHSLHPRKDKAYLTHWGKSEGAVEDKEKKLVFNIFCMFCFFLQFNSNTDVGVSESRGAELSLIWYEFIFFSVTYETKLPTEMIYQLMMVQLTLQW